MKHLTRKYAALLFALVLVGIDQLLKWLVIVYIKPLPGRTLPLIADQFHLTYVENDSMVFGFLGGLSDEGKNVLMIVLSCLTLLILAGLIVGLLWEKIRNPKLVWPVGMIIGGGIGNLIDRTFRVSADSGLHFVVDYLDVRIINFAVFNFADCCVVIGVILVMIVILFFDHHPESSHDAGTVVSDTPSQQDESHV